MTLYEFHCPKCTKDFELLVRSAQSAGAAVCPHCGAKKLVKKLSVFASAVATGAAGPMPCDTGSCPAPARARHRGGCACCH